ncbi:hypothetical protein PoB_001568600 [Plakobranchus ocellatus]|uniref:Uncharacterized protein n=1 Tax=Plakobranchus ocellatus TaxID=259542 RepID=A0AAV3YPV2_9GAST|nr:hypothetical protein PoB_001568600 [Plakobranchus ocellatus]
MWMRKGGARNNDWLDLSLDQCFGYVALVYWSFRHRYSTGAELLNAMGRPSSQVVSGWVRTRYRRVTADLRAASLSTLPPTPPHALSKTTVLSLTARFWGVRMMGCSVSCRDFLGNNSKRLGQGGVCKVWGLKPAQETAYMLYTGQSGPPEAGMKNQLLNTMVKQKVCLSCTRKRDRCPPGQAV